MAETFWQFWLASAPHSSWHHAVHPDTYAVMHMQEIDENTECD